MPADNPLDVTRRDFINTTIAGAAGTVPWPPLAWLRAPAHLSGLRPALREAARDGARSRIWWRGARSPVPSLRVGPRAPPVTPQRNPATDIPANPLKGASAGIHNEERKLWAKRGRRIVEVSGVPWRVPSPDEVGVHRSGGS